MSSGENKTLLAQLVEHWTGIAEVMDSIPYRPEFFFRPYSHYCSSSVHYCEDHFHICFLFVSLFVCFFIQGMTGSYLSFDSHVQYTQSNSEDESFHLSQIEAIVQYFQSCLVTGWGLFIERLKNPLLVRYFLLKRHGLFRFPVSQDDLTTN